ncbi:uncharacterized protein M6B38_207970 [Iris pallida]|uniref:FLZ-type domain-containing protein n=1 Tax=Iris pallida TaxID=29817 RepID=A0AAX6E510_IRIPA|nr:uncharacterized protein M6B38_207970 [Iris pallida]
MRLRDPRARWSATRCPRWAGRSASRRGGPRHRRGPRVVGQRPEKPHYRHRNRHRSAEGRSDCDWIYNNASVTTTRSTNTKVACHGKRRGRFFCGSPPREERPRILPMADFLSRCYLCRKNLHGEDIYMYRCVNFGSVCVVSGTYAFLTHRNIACRGEKAFCSTECRYQQIVSDEFQEKCGTEACRLTSDISGATSYADDRQFVTGIAAA